MIVPTIDLQGGKVVQLMRGEEMVLERNDPMAVAEEFARYGPINVIDVDGARNQGNNLSLIAELAQRFPIHAGGGVREVDDALHLIGMGARRVIVGSAAFKDGGIDEEFLSQLNGRLLSSRIILAVDSSGDEVVCEGWRAKTGLKTVEAASRLQKYCGGLLFTQVDREGTMFGPDMAMARQLLSTVQVPVYIAGGIATAEQARDLENLGARPVMGMALYTGRVSMSAMFCDQVLFDDRGLVPTVVQDATGDVLMLGFSNRDSLQRSLKRGDAWYYDSERQRALRKGESSGRKQRLIRASYDCRNRAVLFQVEQAGDCCHLERHSCFGENTNGGLHQLLRELLEPRGTAGSSGSVRAAMLSRVRRLLEVDTSEGRCEAVAELLSNLAVYMRQHRINLIEVAAVSALLR